jgi:hypothetical protein
MTSEFDKEKKAGKLLKKRGIVLSVNFWHEFRVNFKEGGTEATAYYAGHDLEDAIDAGIQMAERRKADQVNEGMIRGEIRKGAE